MKQLVYNLKRYTILYLHIVAMVLKHMTSYRLNFVIRSLHAISYTAMILGAVLAMYSKTNTLGGWNKDESLLLFGAVHLIFGFQMFFYMKGIEDFVHHRISTGEFDFDLLKPVSSQFLMAFRTPWIDSIIYFGLVLALFIRQVMILHAQITILSSLLFILATIICLVIWYFVLVTYSTISIYVVRSQQVIYFLEKTTDYGLYPTHIFPPIVQFISYTLIPIAFLAYVPTVILLNKTELWMWPAMIAVLIASGIICKSVWNRALQHYSSASS